MIRLIIGSFFVLLRRHISAFCDGLPTKRCNFDLSVRFRAIKKPVIVFGGHITDFNICSALLWSSKYCLLSQTLIARGNLDLKPLN